jgi:Fe(3+) dicitrate transport protein
MMQERFSPRPKAKGPRGAGAAALGALLSGATLLCQETARAGASDSRDEAAPPLGELPVVEVRAGGERPEVAAGSATLLDEKTLFESHLFTVNEALRKVPGIYVRDEEGFGIRPNIGVRGLNPFRSTKMLFLEDGLPLNFAPYGDNDIYYHPPIERFDSVEVMKGAELTQYGPQTLGGAIDYRTPAPPETFGGFASFTGGNRDYLNGHLRFGGTLNGFGGLADYLHKEGEGARDNAFVKLDDVNLKGVAALGPNASLTWRGDFYKEDSQSTFGITEAELRNFGYRYNPFKYDEFHTNRWATSATHDYRFNDDVRLSTSFYWSEFDRDFWRQNNQQPTDTVCGLAFREARLEGQAVDIDDCRFTRGRLRHYNAWGVEPRLHARHGLFGVTSELDAGFRAHFEDQHRRTEDGNSPTARNGVVTEDNDRYADAYSGFLQNRFLLGQWTVTPGLRVESISYRRRNNLPGQLAQGVSFLAEPLPSFALTYAPVSEATLFFGVHRGFAPPRVEDSVYSDGRSVEIGPEKSWNYEFGVRGKPLAGLQSDLTLFHNDFETLTVLGTVGGNDTPVAQGKALFQGLELSGRADGAELFGWSHNPYVQVAYTWVPTAKSTEAFRCLPLSDGTVPSTCPDGRVFGSKAGNRLPYAPEHLLTAKLGYSHPVGFDASLEAVFVSDQFGDFMNLESGADHPNGPDSAEARSGQYGKLKDYAVVNFAATYLVQRNLNLYVSVKNLLDNQYIVDRVRGILPGAPRLVQAGFRYDF